MIIEGANITEVKRLSNSRAGNPKWAITYVTPEAEVITARTQSDASVGYEVTYDYAQRFATLETNPSGTIYAITLER